MTSTRRAHSRAKRPESTSAFGWTLPVWLLRTMSALVAVALVVAVYVLVEGSLSARADADYRSCQVDALQRNRTVDRTLDVLIDTQVALVDANREQAAAIRRDAANQLDAIRIDRAAARAESEASCVRPNH